MDTLKNMRVFTRVVDAGGFTAAADSLRVSPAVISRAIFELEAHLRARLLNRSTRQVCLTPAGEQYLQNCQNILADIDRAEEEASGAHERPEGILRMSSFASIGQHYVLPAISSYRAKYPKVKIELTLSQSAPDLFGGRCDVAVVAAPSLSDSEMVSHCLGSTFCILCASPHYVSSRGIPRTPHGLIEHECLSLNTSVFSTYEWLIEGPEGRELIQISSPLEVNIAEAMIVAIREGLGIGVLPLHAAIEGLRDGTLIRVLPNHTLQKMNIYALYPSRKFTDAKTLTWVDLLRDHFPEAIARDKAMLPSQPTITPGDTVDCSSDSPETHFAYLSS